MSRGFISTQSASTQIIRKPCNLWQNPRSEHIKPSALFAFNKFKTVVYQEIFDRNLKLPRQEE